MTQGENLLVTESVLLMSTTSLVVELVALGLLIFGYNFKRHSKYRQHGIAMAVAVVLHLLTIFSWMIWSFLSLFSGTSIDFFNPLILATLAHVTLGIIAASLGVWLVASWHLQANVQKCFGRKRIMLATITLWFTAIALGIILYIAVVLS